MPGSGSAGSSGQDQPATVGLDYGRQQLESVTEPERVFSLGNKSLSIAIRANPGNSGIVYLGFDGDVSTDTGFPLESGDSISIDMDVNKQNIWAIPDTANDDVRFIVTA